MFGKRTASTANFRFRFRSEPSDPRKDDVVRSVPLSQKQMRRRRWELAWIMGKCLAITAVVVGLLCFAARTWHESITTSPNFAVNEYRFSSNVTAERGGLTKDVVSELLNLRTDLNVMKVDLPALQNTLAALPQVQSALVSRNFPNRIEIQVTEREPLAWLACAARNISPRDTINGRLLDEHGTVFECRSLVNPYNHLPVINVPQLAWLELGQALTDRRVQKALRLIEDFNDQAWCAPLRIQEILVENDYSQTATLTDGATVEFGITKVPEQMKRLARIYEWSKAHGRTVATAQLVAMSNVSVTFAPKAKSGPTPKAPSSASKASPATTKRPPISREAADIRAIVRGN